MSWLLYLARSLSAGLADRSLLEGDGSLLEGDGAAVGRAGDAGGVILAIRYGAAAGRAGDAGGVDSLEEPSNMSLDALTSAAFSL